MALKLSSPSGATRRGTRDFSGQRALTTEPGFANENGQRVDARTGARSTTRDHQIIYRLHCSHCAYEYGCNGLDIKARLCPRCQGGVAGEPLPELSPLLFAEIA